MLPEPLKTVLAGVGTLMALRLLFSAYHFVTFHFFRPSIGDQLTKYKRADGVAYALISGSSAGIGLGIARALVQNGFGVILLGHLEDELTDAAKTLVAECPAAAAGRVRTIVLNCQTASPEEISTAVKSVSSLPISILVNNVGSATCAAPPSLRPLATLSAAEIDAFVNLNARFMARLTNKMLPLLTASADVQKQERSLVLNLSSVGRHGLPWIVMYGATKAFDYAFSLGLASELEADPATAHIDCLAVVPGEVRSQSNAGATFAAPTADDFGRMVVASVDGAVRRGWREIRPDWRHELMAAMTERVLPLSLATKFVRDEMRVKKETVEAAAKKR